MQESQCRMIYPFEDRTKRSDNVDLEIYKKENRVFWRYSKDEKWHSVPWKYLQKRWEKWEKKNRKRGGHNG